MLPSFFLSFSTGLRYASIAGKGLNLFETIFDTPIMIGFVSSWTEFGRSTGKNYFCLQDIPRKLEGFFLTSFCNKVDKQLT